MDVKKLEGALDELLNEYRDREQITGPDGLLTQLTKSLLERAMAAELTNHIGYEKHQSRRSNEARGAVEAEEGSRSRAPGKANSRNGTSRKKSGRCTAFPFPVRRSAGIGRFADAAPVCSWVANVAGTWVESGGLGGAGWGLRSCKCLCNGGLGILSWIRRRV